MENSKISRWLNDAGFSYDPFQNTDSDKEDLLEFYFFDPGDFELVKEQKSSIIHAAKGSGKSAYRKKLEYECSKGQYSGKFFYVKYAPFDHFPLDTEFNDINSYSHVNKILKDSIYQLLIYLTSKPVPNLDDSHWHKFGSYIKYFGININDSRSEKFLEAFSLNRAIVEYSVAHNTVDQLLKNNDLKDTRILSCFIDSLFNNNNNNNNNNNYQNSQEALKAFFNDILNVFSPQFEGMFILVDNLNLSDEKFKSKDFPFSIVSSLIKDYYLITVKPSKIYFKFFLTLSENTDLFDLDAVKLKYMQPIGINWTFEKRKELFQRRLLAHSENKIPSLLPFCDEKLKDKIETSFFNDCNTPRDMILLGKKLIEVHDKNNLNSELLLYSDLTNAIRQIRRQREKGKKYRILTIMLSIIFISLSSFVISAWLLFHKIESETFKSHNSSIYFEVSKPKYFSLNSENFIYITPKIEQIPEPVNFHVTLRHTPNSGINYYKENPLEFSGFFLTKSFSIKTLEAERYSLQLHVRPEAFPKDYSSLFNYDSFYKLFPKQIQPYLTLPFLNNITSKFKLTSKINYKFIVNAGLMRVLPIPNFLVDKLHLKILASIGTIFSPILVGILAIFSVEVRSMFTQFRIFGRKH